ncbi:hypothetical protein A5821_000281 [Enterococcus sp. 7F3_DIV0205]|uniref:LXG domain-containing protein n=1 Tax=Candidatus Enterococcus palustris TaxID=1834189 RepID=A0AAQ3W5J2_9ENTE
MSIDMYVGASKAQGSSASALSQSYQAGFESLQSAIGNFTQDTLLRSKAYDSGKSYFQGVYIPLIQGAILVAEATGKAIEKLPTDYVSQVDSCDLKSSELEAEIQRYETQIQGMQNQIDQVKQLLPVSSERAQHLREASGLIADYTSAKLTLEKQLQKLLAFHAFSSTLFTEVTSLQNAVNQGLAQVSGGQGFDSKTGTFSPKNLKDTRWMITIGNAWDKRQKEIAEINKKARIEREMAALKRAAKVAAADVAMNSFMMNVGLMNMGPSIYGNLKDYGSQKALTASLRPTGMLNGSNKKVSSTDIPNPDVGVVQSRINASENPTRFSPSKNAGMNHIRDRHFNPSKNAGQFTIPETDLKNILQSKLVINTPVKQLESGGFERIVDVGKNIGTVKPSLGGGSTTWIKIITDRAGNIITAYPIPKP